MSLFQNLNSPFGLEEFVLDPSKKYENGIFANGVWQRRKEPVGTFTVQVEKGDFKRYGLTKEASFDFTPALPKIPYTIFENILEHYKDIYNKMKSEVYTSIYWNKVKQDYFIYIPKQTVSGAQVNFENDPEMLNNPDYVIVMDVH